MDEIVTTYKLKKSALDLFGIEVGDCQSVPTIPINPRSLPDIINSAGERVSYKCDNVEQLSFLTSDTFQPSFNTFSSQSSVNIVMSEKYEHQASEDIDILDSDLFQPIIPESELGSVLICLEMDDNEESS